MNVLENDALAEMYESSEIFERFMYEHLGKTEETKMMCYLCEGQGFAQEKIMEFISKFHIRLDAVNSDLERDDDAIRMLKKVKQYVCFCCERELEFLVKCINTHAISTDSCELKLNEFYNVVKIEGDNYIIVDETGQDWMYPASMFEYVSSGAVSQAYAYVRYEAAKTALEKSKHQTALTESVAALALSYEENDGEIPEKYIKLFVEACNARRKNINEECICG